MNKKTNNKIIQSSKKKSAKSIIRNTNWYVWTWLDISVNMDTFYQLYRKNSTLYACINEKVENVWKNWYKIIKKQNNWQILEVNDKNVYDFLNYWNDFEEKISTLITNLDVGWNNYFEKVKNVNWKIIWVKTIDPRSMHILADKYWNILKYVQQVYWDGVEFEPQEIQHDKDKVDLDNPLFWLSKVETLVYDIKWDAEASKSNYWFFKNNWIPAQLVILDPEIDDDSRTDEEEDVDIPTNAEIITKQMIKSFAGWENAHKFMVASWIKDIKNVWTTSKDMEYREYRQFNVERICSVLWVPKTELNYTEGVNYSNWDIQHDNFIKWTIQPLEKKVAKIFTKLLKEAFPTENYELVFSDDLWKIYKEKAEINKILIESGQITINEARADINRQKREEEFADKILVNKWLMLLDDIDINAVSPSNNQV